MLRTLDREDPRTPLTHREQILLQFIKENGPISPSEVERNPPAKLSGKDVRWAITSLVDKGLLRINKHLKLTSR